MHGLYLVPPADPARVLALPFGGPVPPPVGRKLPNATILVRDGARPDLIWKLTPWDRAETVMAELDIHARLAQAGIPGIVGLRKVAGTADHLARAYDYAPHGELARFLREARQPVQARAMLAQVAGSMAGLHGQGILHRDLKAENVLVFADGPVPDLRLADFDRAVALPPGEKVVQPVGSLFHMAPELLAHRPYDHRVDVYAFGILVFEVAHHGARPFPQVATGLPGALTAGEFAAKVIEDGLRPDWHSPDIGLRDLAWRCLAADPDQRPDFATICRDLTGTSPVNAQLKAARDLPQRIGMAASIGLQRRGMEDALCVVEDGGTTILTVFDGLRGTRSSRFAAHSLALMMADALLGDPVETAMPRAFAAVQARLRRLDPVPSCGTTATVAVIGPDGLHVGWVGDSPAWLVADDIAPMIRPHHPSDPAEANRVIAAGGSVRRETRMLDSGETVPWGPLRVHAANGQGGVALTRALGLPGLSPALSHDPEIIRAPTEGARFLVIASDGVSEIVTPDRLAQLCATTTAQAAADAIIAEVLRLGAPDNASVIVADLPAYRSSTSTGDFAREQQIVN